MRVRPRQGRRRWRRRRWRHQRRRDRCAVRRVRPKCFGKAPFTLCLQTVPTAPVTLPMHISTDSAGNGNCGSLGGEIMMVSGADACVIAGTDVLAGGHDRWRVGRTPARHRRDRPHHRVDDELRHHEQQPTGDGPNANPTDCAPIASINGGSTNSGSGGGGGGAGGSFSSKGGDGGSAVGGGVAAGVAQPAPTSFDKLRGGCKGGTGNGTGGAVTGGSGGGAVYLVARGGINITGERSTRRVRAAEADNRDPAAVAAEARAA